MLRTACAQAKRWVEQGISFGAVAVNVSGSQFRTPAEPRGRAVSSALEETGLPARYLEIEVTEDVLMDGWFEHREVLSRMTQAGVTFTVDDFGTGRSSLQRVAQLPVGRLKVAQVFTCDMTRDPTCAALVKATIGLGARSGACGSSPRASRSAGTSKFLRPRQGCRGRGQGFYFARPLPAEEVEPMLRRGVAVAGSGDRVLPTVSRA